MLRFQLISTVDRASIAVRDRGFYAPQSLGRSRRLTPEGYLVCVGVPIARTGMQLYHSSELDGAGLRADKSGVIRVERTPEEVFRPDTIASYEGKSVTVDHPPDFVNPQNRNRFEVGHVQNCRRGTGQDSDLLLADLVIKDPIAIKYVNEQLPEVSAGYDAGYEEIAPGHARQVRLLGNHVALVRRGRAGPRVAIKDSLSTGTTMHTADSMLNAVQAQKIINLGVVYNGTDLKPRIDRVTARFSAINTPFTPPNILEAEGPGNLLDPGDVSTGDLKPHYKRVQEARRVLAKAVDAVTYAGNLTPQFESVADALDALERAINAADEVNQYLTRDSRHLVRRPVPDSFMELNRAVCDDIREMNRRARALYSKGA